MSRSWLERRALGIFPAHSWLYVGRQAITTPPHADSAVASGADTHGEASSLLAAAPAGRWWRPALDVTVSDASARAIVLPWQAGLRTGSQQLRYAEACVEEAGASVASGWVVQYCYRRYGQAGMAYALPGGLIEQLQALANDHGLRLRSVLPAAAAAYSRTGLVSNVDALLLLAEAGRLTALRFERGVLAGIDVQPCGADKALALRRLIRRVQANQATLARIASWSSAETSVDRDLLQESIGASYPGVPVEFMAHRSWE